MVEEHPACLNAASAVERAHPSWELDNANHTGWKYFLDMVLKPRGLDMVVSMEALKQTLTLNIVDIGASETEVWTRIRGALKTLHTVPLDKNLAVYTTVEDLRDRRTGNHQIYSNTALVALAIWRENQWKCRNQRFPRAC